MTPQRLVRKKLVIVGDRACGKTSLLRFFALGQTLRYSLTPKFPSVEHYVTEVKVDDQAYELVLHDTFVHDEYGSLRPSTYPNSHIVLIAFAIDTPESLENVTEKWVAEVHHYCTPSIPIILVGCKADLRRTFTADVSRSHVSWEQGELVAKQIGAHAYKECSVLNDEGIFEIFEAAARASLLARESKEDQKSCVVV